MDNPNFLSPSLREKKRYLAYEVISDGKVPFAELSTVIWHSLINFLGEVGTADAEVRIFRNTYNEEKQLGLIKCSHTAVESVRAALAMIQRIDETPVIVRVIGISGTMKAAQKKFFGEVDLSSF